MKSNQKRENREREGGKREGKEIERKRRERERGEREKEGRGEREKEGDRIHLIQIIENTTHSTHHSLPLCHNFIILASLYAFFLRKKKHKNL